MKSTGIVRRVDGLGRFVLPKEMRNLLDINESPIEIFIEGDNVILRKYQPSCCFCQSFDSVISFEGRLICEECRKKIAKTLK